MINYKKELRFALTNKCNYQCIYCHNEGMCKNSKLLNTATPSDYAFITNVTTRCLDIRKFVLTGGEPLLNKNVIKIAQAIKSNNSKHTTLVTNGSLLNKKRNITKYIDELHVSLGTLDKNIHQFRTNSLTNPIKIKSEITSIAKNFDNIKLNVVMLDFENKDCGNILELIDFAKNFDIELYLIEYFPETEKYYYSFRKIENLISSLGYKRSREEENKVLFIKKDSPNIKIVFVPCAFVESPLISNPEIYCKENQSIYILPDLKIQPCFMNEKKIIDISQAVKNRDEGELIRLIKIARAQIGCNCPLTY